MRRSRAVALVEKSGHDHRHAPHAHESPVTVGDPDVVVVGPSLHGWRPRDGDLPRPRPRGGRARVRCDGLVVRSVRDLDGVTSWLAGPRDRPLVVDAKVVTDEPAWWLAEAFRGH